MNQYNSIHGGKHSYFLIKGTDNVFNDLNMYNENTLFSIILILSILPNAKLQLH